jgi:hypothetical protein
MNDLASIPPGVFDSLSNLISIDLHDNQIASLPPGVFDRTTQLQELDLRKNRISSYPYGVFNHNSFPPAEMGLGLYLDSAPTTCPSGSYMIPAARNIPAHCEDGHRPSEYAQWLR